MTVHSALRRFWPLVAVGALLGAAALASALSSPQITHVPFTLHPVRRPPPATAGPLTRPNPLVESSAPSRAQATIELGWLGGVIEAVCIVAVVLVAALLIFLLVRNSLSTARSRPLVESASSAARSQREEVLAAVDAGLSDLDDNDRNPRRAVIACWVRLEQAAAAAGTPRQPGDSPTDLVVRLLDAHQVSAGVLYQLADVYRVARYATHTVDSAMRESARTALRQLRAELTVSHSGPLEQVP